MNRVILASCDELYFQTHAQPFIKSILENNGTAWVDIVAPEDQHERLRKTYSSSDFILSCSNGPSGKGEITRVVYAQARFNGILLSSVFNFFDEVLILDVDSFLRKPIDWSDFSDCDYSLFLRDPLPGTVGWEQEGTRCAAGAVYFKKTATDFIRILNAMMANYGARWFVDQFALHEVHKHFQVNNLGLKFTQMPQKYIDWEFNPDTIVWTGKGSRKTSVPYLKERAIFECQIV